MAKPKPTSIIEEHASSGIIRMLIHVLVDSWVLMIALGILGHRLPLHYLFRFGYGECLWVIIAIECLYSAKSKWQMRPPDSKGN